MAMLILGSPSSRRRFVLAIVKAVFVSSLLVATLFVLGCPVQGDEPVIWFVEGNRTIRTMNPTTTQEKVIVAADDQATIGQLEISPDGKMIAYAQYVAGRGGAIWLATSDGSNAKRLMRDYKRAEFHWLDDAQILLMGVDDLYRNPAKGDVMLYDLTQGATRPVSLLEDPILCSSSSLAASRGWVMMRTPKYGLGHFQVVGDTLVQILDVPIVTDQFPDWAFGCPVWTPDGGTIVLRAVSGFAGTMSDLFTAQDRGQSVLRLTQFSPDYGLTEMGDVKVSPDGQWVALVIALEHPRSRGLPDATELALVPIGGGAPFLIAEASGASFVAWSPDSRNVAINTYPQNDHSAPLQLHVVDVQTKTIRQLIANDQQQTVFDWR
jgi:hypothetical protein